jgi:hypothetical protein
MRSRLLHRSPRGPGWPRARLLTGLMLASSLLIGATIGCGGGGGDPIGSLLAGIESTANGIISHASAQGQVLEVTAAGQVNLAVQNARSAFAEDLEKGLEDVDDATQRTIANLQALEDELHSDSTEVLNAAIAGSQQLVNSLPFANRNPQVRSYSPQFVRPSDADTVQIVVDGNFFWAYQENLPITLELEGHDYEANLDITSQVGFEVPASVFASQPDRFSRVSATLTVPYEKGIVFKSTRPGVFQLLLTVLPTSPVRALTVTSEVQVSGIESRTLTMPAGASMAGGGWRVNSWQDCQNHDDPHSFSASPGGWSIEPSSVAAVISNQGRHPTASGADILAASTTGFVVRGWTTAHCFLGISNGSGDITYFVTYTETRPTSTASAETRDLLPLRWGDQRVVPVARGHWTVHVELWNGTVLDFARTDSSNPYVSVTDDGDTVTVKAASPETLILAL